MTSPQPYAQPSTAVDDTGSGLAMFLIFTAAVLIVTGAVALLAVVGTWWMLGVTFAIDLSMTTIVVLTIVFVMDGRAQKIAIRGRTSAAPDQPDAARPQARIRPVTAP